MKYLAIIGGLCLLAVTLHWCSVDNARAMAACEKTHSHDTCFYSLMR